MSDILKDLQAEVLRAGKQTERKMDRKDRQDATMAPDARAARATVRGKTYHSLAELAHDIAAVTAEARVKHELEEAVDRFYRASHNYMREEGKPTERVIDWIGPPNGFLRLSIVDGVTPPHKIELTEAWNGLLNLVNHATKVGIEKPHREHPIRLMVDIENPENSPNHAGLWE